MSMPEYVPTDLPQYVKVNSRTEFSSAVVGSGHVLIFAEQSGLVAKNPDGTYTELSGGGTDVSDATALAEDIASGKTAYVSGGKVTGTHVCSSGGGGGGAIVLPAGADISSMTVSGCGVVVSSGAAVTSTTVSGGGTIVISSGGSANDTAVNSGGGMTVSSGGTGSGTTVNSGGSMTVSSGGTADSTTVNSGGSMTVSSGGSANDTAVNSGGGMTVSSGGTADSTTVNSCGSMTVSSGGTASGTVENGGCVDVKDGADVSFASNTFSGIVISSASATVHSGTTADSTTINNGGNMTIYSGGTASGTTVNSGGTVNVSNGGTADSTTVNSGGGMTVSSGGSANDTAVNSGGGMTVSSGGTGSGTTVNSGGSMTVSSGGIADDTTVKPGGIVNVLSGGTITTVTISGGTTSPLNTDPGADIHTVVIAGGTIPVTSGTSVSSAVVEPDATLHLSGSGEIRDSLVVSSGGTAYLPIDALINNLTSETGAVIIYDGGTAGDGARLKNPDGDIVSSGTTLTSMVVSSGWLGYAFRGGVQASPEVLDGGVMRAYSSGTISGGTVHSGGVVNLYNDGRLSGTVVESGGYANFFGRMLDFGGEYIAQTVEVRDAVISSGAKVNNLTYLGDAVVYRNSGEYDGLYIPVSAVEVQSGDIGYLYCGDIMYSGGVTIRSGGEFFNYGEIRGANALVVESGGTAWITPSFRFNGTATISSGAVISSFYADTYGYPYMSQNIGTWALDSGVRIGNYITTTKSIVNSGGDGGVMTLITSDFAMDPGSMYEVPAYITILPDYNSEQYSIDLVDKEVKIYGGMGMINLTGLCQLYVYPGGYLDGGTVTTERSMHIAGNVMMLQAYMAGADIHISAGATFWGGVHGIVANGKIPAVRIEGDGEHQIELYGEEHAGFEHTLYVYASANFGSLTVNSRTMAQITGPVSDGTLFVMDGGLAVISGGTAGTPDINLMMEAGSATVASALVLANYGPYGGTVAVISGGTYGTMEMPLYLEDGQVIVYDGGTVYYAGERAPTNSGGTIISAGE